MFETILNIAGMATSAIGTWMQADAAEEQAQQQAAAVSSAGGANREVSLWDAAVAVQEASAAEISAGAALRDKRRQVDLMLQSAEASLAGQGVVLRTGSALDVMRDMAAEGRRETDRIRYNGLTRAERYRSLAARYRMLAAAGLRDSALQAALIEEAGQDTALGVRVSGAATLLKDSFALWGED